ncbi:hypothetical protein BDF14DRAFT_1785811 [Spinellus fusiger]|nr:hypothetical protein BDF14DRAFT_1785811 [Spinellus fusiger]
MSTSHKLVFTSRSSFPPLPKVCKGVSILHPSIHPFIQPASQSSGCSNTYTNGCTQ